MSKTKCDLCHTVGHLSNYCTESWRQFHSTVSNFYLIIFLYLYIYIYIYAPHHS